jgi:hypothetical protein
MFQDQIKEILQSGELSSNEFQVYYTLSCKSVTCARE